MPFDEFTIEQLAGDRVGRFREGGEAVDGFGKLGRAARAVPHLAGDEARIDRARPHDARQRRRQRTRPRPLRIGHVEHNQVDRPAEELRRRGEAADERHILGAFQEIAARIVAGVHEKIRGDDAPCEGVACLSPVSRRAAIGVRRRGQIGGANGVAVGAAAQ